MVRNNKLLETLFTCVKKNGECSGCFYGDGLSQPHCMLHLMNDILFFFANPVPSQTAQIIPLENLEEILSDRKDHLAFCEYISSIHVANPLICTVKSSGNFITFHNPQKNFTESFNKQDYYTKFRVWNTKPTDSLRNSTPWTPTNGYQYETDSQPINQSKTNEILSYISKMTYNPDNIT